ncbi:MAG: tripartite tricarboxylate transporter TctB family protein [Polaromonas sp.]|nr:tripartite tricarboxylate transporter TctB family protein [Polaromonas sp.]
MTPTSISPAQARLQAIVGGGVLLLAAGLAFGAISIPSDAGYAGAGPNFLPWVVSIALAVCGGFLVWEALSGGFREMEPADDAAPAYWAGFAWVSAGLLSNAALITTLGFILSCTLCFVLAVQGLRGAEGKSGIEPRIWLKNIAIGLAISAPVYWAFTQFLAINLPGLTSTGWL